MTTDPTYAPYEEPARAAPVGLALVIALNGVLIIRPEDLYPPIDGLRLYYILTVCALLYYAPKAFDDFHLRLQFKVFDPNNCNSGVFIRKYCVNRSALPYVRRPHSREQ